MAADFILLFRKRPLTAIFELYRCRGWEILTDFISSTGHPSPSILCYHSTLSIYRSSAFIDTKRPIYFSPRCVVPGFFSLFSFFFFLPHFFYSTMSTLQHQDVINRESIYSFSSILQIGVCHVYLSGGRDSVMDVLRSVREILNDGAEELVAVMLYKNQVECRQQLFPSFIATKMRSLANLARTIFIEYCMRR